MFSKNLASVWNNLKKIPEIKKRIASSVQLNDGTVIPFVVALFKDIYKAYIQSDRNSWGYQISCYDFNGLDKHEAKKELIKQYNNCLYSYSIDKTNPWIIDERDKRFIRIIKKHPLENKEKLSTYLDQPLNNDLTKKSFPSTQPMPSPTYWEKIEESLNRNSFFKFINTIWDAINSHTTLLRWISFTLILFSLPFPSVPLILVIIGSIVGYLVFRLTSFTTINKISEAIEEDKIRDHIKQEVFNKAQYKKQRSALQSQLLHLDIKIETLYKNLYLQTNKNSDKCIEPENLNAQFENSSIYKKLNQVYPKTQLIASLVTKVMSITLSAYLLSWAISILFNFIGALTLASLISSPIAVGLFILIPACIFSIRHIIKYQSRKNAYKRNIQTLLKEPCELSFIDKKGELQTIILEKWEKFEYLSKEIQLLEQEINQFIENNQSSEKYQKLFSLFRDSLKNNDIYKSNYQDKRQRQNISSSTKRRKILSRLFSFSAGGFYGFSLGEQIAFESRLGFKNFFEIISFPLYILVFIPLIIIHGIANFLTYHLNSRQRNLLFFAEHLDSKLQILEHRREILSSLTVTVKELDSPIINKADNEKNPHVSTEKGLAYLDLAVKKTNPKEYRPTTKFFMSSTRSLSSLLLKEQYSYLSETNETDSCPNLTR